MSDSPRPVQRLAVTLAAVMATVAVVVLIVGGIYVLSTGTAEPWLAAAAVALIGSLTWLSGQRRK